MNIWYSDYPHLQVRLDQTKDLNPGLQFYTGAPSNWTTQMDRWVKQDCFLLFNPLIPALKIFENRILRQIFGPKREWRRLHNEELHRLHPSPYIVRVIKSRRLGWVDHVARMEESRSAFKILTGTPTRKLLGRPRRRW